MSTPIHNIGRIEHATISTLADEVIFALGDYLKYKTIDKEKIDLGIELCNTIIRGEKIRPDEMTIEEMPDYEKYRVIKNNKNQIESRGVSLDTLSQKASGIISTLEDIRNEAKVEEEKIKAIQNFFIAISLPFWKEHLSSFQQRKISRSLHIG